MEKEELELRSPEIREIFSFMPSRIIRYGNLFIFIFMLSLIVLTWFIRYPDNVKAVVKITSSNYPREIYSQLDGRVSKILVREGQFVKKGTILGYMESSSNYDKIADLALFLKKLTLLIEDGNQLEFISLYRSAFFDQLGDLQPYYKNFTASWYDYNSTIGGGILIRKKRLLNSEIMDLNQLKDNLRQQETILKYDDSLAIKEYQAQENLYKSKVISVIDFNKEKSKYLLKSLSVRQIRSSIINVNSSLAVKYQELEEIENETIHQKVSFLHAINTLHSEIESWKKKYVLVTPVDGKVNFLKKVLDNQYIKYRELILVVSPVSDTHYGELYIKQNNLGKVELGDKVTMSLLSYPASEFGYLEGKIAEISSFPRDTGYYAKVVLKRGLVTTLKKNLRFKEGLMGSANIMTRDMNVLQRIYRNTLKIRDR